MTQGAATYIMCTILCKAAVHHVEFPQSQARASEVNPTQVLQGTR